MPRIVVSPQKLGERHKQILSQTLWKEPTLLMSWFCTSGLQNWDRIDSYVCCFNPPNFRSFVAAALGKSHRRVCFWVKHLAVIPASNQFVCQLSVYWSSCVWMAERPGVSQHSLWTLPLKPPIFSRVPSPQSMWFHLILKSSVSPSPRKYVSSLWHMRVVEVMGCPAVTGECRLWWGGGVSLFHCGLSSPPLPGRVGNSWTFGS